MKYLIVLIVIFIGIGIWRSRRPAPAAPTQTAKPQDMVACAHCGIHLPRTDALLHGPHAYCCVEHHQRGPQQ